ncbi:7131_t:CDS:10 [Paraglomus brasilianum]|uniref:7131_t:CDS:1 n=1 Tax=Paraglomus brasilianum TaxID=144538 RepID=A0A9N8WBJ9_9GLOM|nr:7131_t:CDS:10 [Paraglomus brasilianum]
MGKNTPKNNSPIIIPIAPIEDEPLSSMVENAKVVATDTSPPLPALMTQNDNRDIILQSTGNGNGDSEERNLTLHHPGHFREDPVGFMMAMGAFYQGTGWRSYKNYIGARILYEGYTEETKERVLNSERVRYMIAYLAEKQANILAATSPNVDLKIIGKKKKHFEKELEAVANQMVEKLVADLSSLRFVRLFGFFVNNILVRMYHQGVHISEREFLEATLPHIVAGDNLNLPIVGRILKGGGAFFIRRSWGEDLLYGSVVREYVEGLLERGHNLECFIEGTRSRTGKLLPPKLGVLKIMLDCVLSGRAKDCWLVPMSIQYDKVIETETYVNELLGNPKEKESLWGIMTNTRLLQLKWGRIVALEPGYCGHVVLVLDLHSTKRGLESHIQHGYALIADRIHKLSNIVRFSKPYSLSQFIQAQVGRRRTFDPTNEQNKVTLLRALGYRILSDIGVGRAELIRRVDWLKAAIVVKGGRVADFGDMTTGEIVDRAMNVLKDLIKERKDLLETVFCAENRFELSFYRNQVIHLFVSEAIVSAAMYTKIKIGGSKSTQRFDFHKLLETVTFLSQLLKVEFVYRPGEIENNLYDTLEGLVKDNVFVFEDGTVELSDAERAIGRENYDFYCFLIWPFIETYWLAAVSLFSMAPPMSASLQQKTTISKKNPAPITWFDERDFHNKCQLFGKTLYYQGDLSYFEAVNKETLKNAFIRLEELNIILVKRSRNTKILPTIALSPEYVPTRNAQGAIEPKGKLWDLVEQIGKFRREGKNRRDNATVSFRVLRLAEIVGQPSTADVGVMNNLMGRSVKTAQPEAKL